jgi:Uma2 family endonuclease
MTLEDFLEAEEEPGYRYELARGVLEATEVPDDPHGQVVWNIQRLIYEYTKQHPGMIRRSGGAGEFRLWLPGMISGRNPDVAIVLQGTAPDHRGRRPPSIVFEVVSEGGEARDYLTKREEYLAFGLREYWIVDPRDRKVTVLVRSGDVWREEVFTQDRSARSAALPGFSAHVAELWAEPPEGTTTADE